MEKKTAIQQPRKELGRRPDASALMRAALLVVALLLVAWPAWADTVVFDPNVGRYDVDQQLERSLGTALHFRIIAILAILAAVK